LYSSREIKSSKSWYEVDFVPNYMFNIILKQKDKYKSSYNVELKKENENTMLIKGKRKDKYKVIKDIDFITSR